MAFDAFSEQCVRDPYPHYAELHEGGSAVHREVQPNGMVTWLVSSYAQARDIFLDPRFSSSFEVADQANLRRGGILNSVGDTTLGPAMILSDPPVHTRLRRLVSSAFTPGRLEALRPSVEAIAEELLCAIEPNGLADLIAEFAEPLPVGVICALLGIDPVAHADVRTWMNAMLTTPTSAESKEHRQNGARALASYLAEVVAVRQRHVNLDLPEPDQPDLLSALIRARDGEGRLDERELVGMMLQLLTGGFETTKNLIGNGMLALLKNPDQLRVLRDRPELLATAIEELLRYDSPVPRASYRVAKVDVKIDGVTIPAGSLVSVLVGSANRDPHRFPRPDELDITRGDHQHLAFAHGIHYCLGASLARLEGEVAIGALLERFPDIRLQSEAELCWRSNSIFMRGLEALPVAFTATQR